MSEVSNRGSSLTAGLIACILAGLGILILGIVFFPIVFFSLVAIVALIATVQAVRIKHSSARPGQLSAPQVFDEPDLLASPVRRAAYSDRTAWLMAAMSELAYFKFEESADDGQKALATALGDAGFELINVYHVADTQAFLAKKQSEGDGSDMRVLAFRGTEKSVQDFRTDLDAQLTAPNAAIENEKIRLMGLIV